MNHNREIEQMLTDKINELREELNKQVISGNVHKRSILQLSQELDRYIVEYLKNKGGIKKKQTYHKKVNATQENYRINIK
jgi:hypothetical protein